MEQRPSDKSDDPQSLASILAELNLPQSAEDEAAVVERRRHNAATQAGHAVAVAMEDRQQLAAEQHEGHEIDPEELARVKDSLLRAVAEREDVPPASE